MRLAKSSAVVSGGAGGLGEATVRRLHQAGMSVVVADLDADRGTALADELGSDVRFVQTDLTLEDSVQAAVAAAQDLNPLRVSVAADGAGSATGRVVGRDGAPMALSAWNKTIEVYLTGTSTSCDLPPHSCPAMPNWTMEREGWSSIRRRSPPTRASRSSCLRRGQSWSGRSHLGGRPRPHPRGSEGDEHRPGTFFTPSFRLPEEEAQARWWTGVPFPKRMGRPEEYAALVEQIAVNDYLNGETIRIDGAQRFGPK